MGLRRGKPTVSLGCVASATRLRLLRCAARRAKSDDDMMASSDSVISLGPFEREMAQTICSWVQGSEMKFVCSEPAGRLLPSIIQRWADQSVASFLMHFRGEPIAFATASRQEWMLPDGLCEICHAVVSPGHRRAYHGSFFVQWITHFLIGSGYSAVVGRACRDNDASLRLMRYLRWKEVTGKEAWSTGEFRWFQGPAKRWT